MAATTEESFLKLKPWTIAVPLVLVALMFLPTSAVLIAGMLPTIVARIIDTSPGRRFTITVGAMNLVGSLYFVNQIWSVGHGVGDIMPTLGNSMGWLCALVGAGAGWVLFAMMSPIITRLAHAQTALRLRRLGQDQEKLVAEWGETVRGAYGIQTVAEEEEEGPA